MKKTLFPSSHFLVMYFLPLFSILFDLHFKSWLKKFPSFNIAWASIKSCMDSRGTQTVWTCVWLLACDDVCTGETTDLPCIQFCASAAPGHLLLLYRVIVVSTHSFLLYLLLRSSCPPPCPTRSYDFNDDRLMHWPGACRVIMGKWTCKMHGPLTSILTLTATTCN